MDIDMRNINDFDQGWSFNFWGTVYNVDSDISVIGEDEGHANIASGQNEHFPLFHPEGAAGAENRRAGPNTMFLHVAPSS